MLSARPAQASHSSGGQDLHEPGEDDGVRVVFVDQFPHLREGGRLGLGVAGGERDVVERDAVGAGDVAQ